ncbi:MAG: DUF1924 domain-containing protein [Candidatus Sedimenticola endophacoides]
MHHRLFVILLLAASGGTLAGGAADTLLQTYRDQGAGPFQAETGRTLWTKSFTAKDKPRGCTDCHGTDLTRAGRHRKTGKPIQPMSPAVNPKRLSDPKKIEKWFLRNCKWTLGRECTPQEKGDYLTYLRNPDN